VIAGISRSVAAAVEKPPVGPSSHCIGVRMAVRPGNDWLSPIPISSPYLSTGVPGMENCSAYASSMCRRSPRNIGASRRRTPRLYSRMSGDGANAVKTWVRCSSVSRLRSNSS